MNVYAGVYDDGHGGYADDDDADDDGLLDSCIDVWMGSWVDADDGGGGGGGGDGGDDVDDDG